MSPPPTSATPSRRVPGAALPALLVALGLFVCLLFPPSRQGPGAPSGQDPAVAASLAAVGGGQVPPQDAHRLVVRKKHRRTELKPAVGEDLRTAIQPTPSLAAAPAAIPARRAAQAPTPHRGPSAPASAAPQLRLQPGQAPPAA